jgi:hypothetical protein
MNRTNLVSRSIVPIHERFSGFETKPRIRKIVRPDWRTLKYTRDRTLFRLLEPGNQK